MTHTLADGRPRCSTTGRHVCLLEPRPAVTAVAADVIEAVRILSTRVLVLFTFIDVCSTPHTVRSYTTVKTTRLSMTGWPVTVGVVEVGVVIQPGADAERYRCAFTRHTGAGWAW